MVIMEMTLRVSGQKIRLKLEHEQTKKHAKTRQILDGMPVNLKVVD